MEKLVFDVGGTFIKYAIMNNEGEIIEKGKFPTPMESQPVFLESLAAKYAEFKDRVDGIAISLPGNIDSNTGYVNTAGALKYNANCNLSQLIQKAIEEKTGDTVNIAIENDGKSAALAEFWKGNLAGCNNGAVIILGTGIGGGIIVDKKLVKGNNFFAGELSFLMKDMSSTGFTNALASHASAKTLTNKVAAYKGLPSHEVDGFKVFNGLKEEDEHCKQALDEVSTALGGLIYNLECIIDPEKVLLGGGISQQPALLEAVKAKTDVFFDNMHVAMPKPEVNVCKYFNDSNLIGALYNYHLLYGTD